MMTMRLIAMTAYGFFNAARTMTCYLLLSSLPRDVLYSQSTCLGLPRAGAHKAEQTYASGYGVMTWPGKQAGASSGLPYSDDFGNLRKGLDVLLLQELLHLLIE